MLPDFPDTKEKLMDFWIRWTAKRQREYLGFFADIPMRSSREGERWEIQRNDGSTSSSKYDLIHAGITVHVDEVPELIGQKLADKLDALARQFADQMGTNFFNSLDKELAAAGQVRNAHGKEFDGELFLEALGSVGIQFDKSGIPIMPALIVSPQMSQGIRRKLEDADRDPEFKKKFNILVERKRDEWRARESRRKLVE